MQRQDLNIILNLYIFFFFFSQIFFYLEEKEVEVQEDDLHPPGTMSAPPNAHKVFGQRSSLILNLREKYNF